MTDQKAPAVVDILAPIFRSYTQKHGAQDYMPALEYDAAKWWLSIMEKPGPHDYPEPIFNKFGDLAAWQTPYHDRLLHALRRFLTLETDQQRIIVKCIDAGIPYRGDTYQGYCDIAKHHQRMHENPEEYRANARAWIERGFKATEAAQ